jgi:hypothetical protein
MPFAPATGYTRRVSTGIGLLAERILECECSATGPMSRLAVSLPRRVNGNCRLSAHGSQRDPTPQSTARRPWGMSQRPRKCQGHLTRQSSFDVSGISPQTLYRKRQAPRHPWFASVGKRRLRVQASLADVLRTLPHCRPPGRHDQVVANRPVDDQKPATLSRRAVQVPRPLQN